MPPKPKRWQIIGAAQINFSVEIEAKTEALASERVENFNLQDFLDNGAVTVDELELGVPEHMVRQ